MSLLRDLKLRVRQHIQSDPKTPINIVQTVATQFKFPAAIVRKGLQQKQFAINGKVFQKENVNVSRNDKLTFQDEIVIVQHLEKSSSFDIYISTLLKKLSDTESIGVLSFENKNKFCAFALEYFAVFGYDIADLTRSVYNEGCFRELEEFYKRNFASNSESKVPRRKELVDTLLTLRSHELTAFDDFVTSVKAGLYDQKESSLFKDFRKITTHRAFTDLIKPLLEFRLDPQRLITKLVNDYKAVKTAATSDEKFELKSRLIKEYNAFKKANFVQEDHSVALGLIAIIGSFQTKMEEAVGFQDTGVAELYIHPEERTYNLTNSEITVYMTIENKGTGVAKNITVNPVSNKLYSIVQQELLELLPPKQRRKVKLQITMSFGEATILKQFFVSFKLRWSNDFGHVAYSKRNAIKIVSQEKNLPWDELLISKPYDIAIVDDPNKLFGREKFIEELKWNIEKNRNITSYIIYGQKRVGKSSIIKTLETIYKEDPNVVFVYKIIADVKNTDANRTFFNVGEHIAKILKSEFRRKHMIAEELLPDLNQYSFSGSLSPLSEIIDHLTELNKNLRIIIALDEFDELNKEFFEDTELGKTFALNIGKGLNQKPNVGFILIGSENMITKKIHGMRLNTFNNKKVDTFNKESEFEAYSRIITEPAKSCLNFASEALVLLYDYTNGNPYFTNMVSDKIFRNAYEKKISFIDFDFAKLTTEHFIKDGLSSFEFEHFWKDGLLEGDNHYQKELDRRKRLLTAYAEVKKSKESCTWADVKRKIKYPKTFSLSEQQMEDTLNEFKQRGIVNENANGELQVVPLLFENWLVANGFYHIIATLDDKDEILDKVLQEEKLYVSDEELKELRSMLGSDDPKLTVHALRIFLNQFIENSSQRLVADFLKNTLVVSKMQMLDHVKKARREIWETIEVNTGEKNLRKDAEIVCLPDSFVQNKAYAEFIKKTFNLSAVRLIKQAKEVENFSDEIEKIIFFEPLIDCPYYYRNEIATILKAIHPRRARILKLYILTFIITDEAKAALEELISNHFAFDYRILPAKVVQRSEITPFYSNHESVNNPTLKVLSEFDKAISDEACLVKVGDIVPYQCFPFLWSSELPNYVPLFHNTTRLKSHVLRMETSSKLKSLNFDSETNKIEFKASLAEPAPNWKEIKKTASSFKMVPHTKTDAVNELRLKLDELYALKMPSDKRAEIVNHIKHAIAKNLSAFSNTHGGELYVGIEDDFTVSGLRYDYAVHKTKEDIRRAFSQLVEKYIGIGHAAAFDLEFIVVKDTIEVLKIIVSKSKSEVWVKVDKNGRTLAENQREIYIREQHGAKQLFTKDYYEWKSKL